MSKKGGISKGEKFYRQLTFSKEAVKEEGLTMKKVFLTVCLVVLTMVISVMPAQSFNPAAHVYIADHVFPNVTVHGLYRVS